MQQMTGRKTQGMLAFKYVANGPKADIAAPQQARG
jgi:hypothetical protein